MSVECALRRDTSQGPQRTRTIQMPVQHRIQEGGKSVRSYSRVHRKPWPVRTNGNLCRAGRALQMRLPTGHSRCRNGCVTIATHMPKHALAGKNNVTCAIPKCSDAKSPCDKDAECVDTKYGYTCRCRKGFRGVGTAQLGCQPVRPHAMYGEDCRNLD